MYDVIIIGGGVVGAAAAYELSRYRLRIALVEQEQELSFGVSKANSGIIHPGTQNPPHSLKGRLCVEGNRLVRELSRPLSLDFKQVGELVVAFDDIEVGRLWQMKQEGEMLGVPGLEVVSRDWLRDNEPNLNHDALAALYAPTAGIISPYRFVYALGESAALNGVEILTSTRVERIDRADSGFRFTLHTSQGRLDSRYVVNCAGLYADDVSAMAGSRSITIQPRKGEEYILDKRRRYLTRHLLFPVPTPESKGILVTRTSDGNPMIGPTAFAVDDREDLSTTDAGLQQVLSVARRLVPSIDEADIIAYFAGLRPAAGEDFVIRHEESVPGFVNVAGIQSPGLTASPAIARYVSALLAEAGLALVPSRARRRHAASPRHLFSLPVEDVRRLVQQEPEYGDIVCRCETVSLREVKDAIRAGASTLDGVKFRTRAGAGRCHGSFCTCRLMRILASETGTSVTAVSKRGKGSEMVVEDRCDA